jgi:hypothetical protein
MRRGEIEPMKPTYGTATIYAFEEEEWILENICFRQRVYTSADIAVTALAALKTAYRRFEKQADLAHHYVK